MLSIQKGRWGLILEDEQLMNDEHFLQGPSGLDLELVEVLQGSSGLNLELVEVLQGPSGLDLGRDDERRTKRDFLILREPGCLRASEFQSFKYFA
ncbi:hypothetical protein ACFX12_035374 [Malus domestica]